MHIFCVQVYNLKQITEVWIFVIVPFCYCFIYLIDICEISKSRELDSVNNSYDLLECTPIYRCATINLFWTILECYQISSIRGHQNLCVVCISSHNKSKYQICILLQELYQNCDISALLIFSGPLQHFFVVSKRKFKYYFLYTIYVHKPSCIISSADTCHSVSTQMVWKTFNLSRNFFLFCRWKEIKVELHQCYIY